MATALWMPSRPISERRGRSLSFEQTTMIMGIVIFDLDSKTSPLSGCLIVRIASFHTKTRACGCFRENASNKKPRREKADEVFYTQNKFIIVSKSLKKPDSYF